MWALSKNIILAVEHIPGTTNCEADAEFRTQTDRTDWSLNPKLFGKINLLWGSLGVDLFASRLSNQLPWFFSWKPDPLAEATDAFNQQWGPLKGYTNPPWCLVGRVLSQVRSQNAWVIQCGRTNCGTRDAIRLPETTSVQQGHFSDSTPQFSDGIPTTTSRVAYLRQRFGGFQTKLKNSSLHPGAAKNQFPLQEMVGLVWGCDPISGTTSDVANFLAELHSQGYQTNSLNAYRSAISSVHDKVDDVKASPSIQTPQRGLPCKATTA